MDKRKEFEKELKLLLNKFDAELILEDLGEVWAGDIKIVVEFNWDVNKEEESTPQLILGTYVDGKPN